MIENENLGEEDLASLMKMLDEMDDIGDTDIDYNVLMNSFGLDLKELEQDMSDYVPQLDLVYRKSTTDAISPSYAYKTDSGFDLFSTKEIWQYGAYTAIGSLDLMCACLEIPTPKDGEINGGMVHDAYWSQNRLKEIGEYCERDVEVLIHAIKKLKELQ